MFNWNTCHYKKWFTYLLTIWILSKFNVSYRKFFYFGQEILNILQEICISYGKKYFPMEFYFLKVNILHDRWESLITEMVITLKVTLKVIIYHRTYLNFSIDAPKTGAKMQSYHRHTFVLSDIVLKPNWLIYIICGHTCLPFSFMVLIELFIHLNKTFVFNIINVSKVYCS